MQAIATLLNQVADEHTRSMWNELEHVCGLSGIRLTPTPHFTWFGADSFDLAEVRKEFENLSQDLRTIYVNTVGLGIFPTEKPVLYLPIIKNRALLDMQEKIWKRLHLHGTNVPDLYNPELWIPHVTLAHYDLTKETITCAIDSLLDLSLNFKIVVNNLALIYATNESAGIIHKKMFL